MAKKADAPLLVGGKIDNVLGPNTSYNGTIRSDGNVRVEGIYEGRIETSGNVIVGPSAKVLADIVANAVQVWGAVRGSITAQSRLEIMSSGRVWADIRATSLLIDEGGSFRGQCLMAGDNLEALALLPPIVESRADLEGIATPAEETPVSATTARN